MKRWVVLGATVVLSACSTPNTALELMREQRQVQLAIQERDARQSTESRLDEGEMYLASIRKLHEEGRNFAVLAHLDAYEQRFGPGADSRLMRAEALRITGQQEQSEAVYRELLTFAQSAAAWRGLGLLAGEAGNLAEALPALERAAELAPTDVNILNDLGYARLLAGQREQARIPLAQAAELAPDNRRVIANLALFLVAAGQVPRAETVMARAGLSEEARGAIRAQAQALPQSPLPLAVAVPGRGLQAAAVASDRPVVLNRSAPLAVTAPVDNIPRTERAGPPPPAQVLASSSSFASPTLSLFDRLAVTTE